eukprot:TRINITY_DN6139_c0_g1_i1.p3 TRINITY_DN6139_c0_g1~~TRINITY_DN6139_c0_g1_i1.p3  ORF type:complete len:152 (+),score=58.31 TRINITY_DN6139_c0_g1_i1:31-456(+)
MCIRDSAEAVLVEFDPTVTSYEALLRVYWDRSQVGGKFDFGTQNQQGNDKGTQYRSVIFYCNEEQQALAEASRAEVERQLQAQIEAAQEKPWKKVAVEVQPAQKFWMAEEIHQQYLAKGNSKKGVPQSAEDMCTDPIRCYG